MRVIVSSDALADIEASDAWWRANRPDAPDLVRADIAAALEDLGDVAPSLVVFRRLRGGDVRRRHVPRVHRHMYFVTEGERVLVLAVWGAVRGVLPALRARLARVQQSSNR